VGRHTEWVGYVLGCLAALVDERKVSLAGGGLSILVSSDVPESKGVASSAALEVATMRALGALFGLEIHGRELALLCQRVENEVSVVVDVYVQVHADKFAHVCVSCASICLSRTPFPLTNPKSPI
jgi:galactokinase